MRIKGYALMLALLLAPAAALAQQAAPAAGTGPIDRLLHRKTELALTQEQVQMLEAIGQKSAAREQELVRKVTEARGVPPGVPARTQAATPAERRALREKGQPYLGELRQLHMQQMQQARGILTAEQNARAWGRAGECCGTGPGAMRRGGGRGPGPMHGAGMGPRRSR